MFLLASVLAHCSGFPVMARTPACGRQRAVSALIPTPRSPGFARGHKSTEAKDTSKTLLLMLSHSSMLQHFTVLRSCYVLLACKCSALLSNLLLCTHICLTWANLCIFSIPGVRWTDHVAVCEWDDCGRSKYCVRKL